MDGVWGISDIWWYVFLQLHKQCSCHGTEFLSFITEPLRMLVDRREPFQAVVGVTRLDVKEPGPSICTCTRNFFSSVGRSVGRSVRSL